jgi:hypothetical protein
MTRRKPGKTAVTAAWDMWPLGMVTVEALTQRLPACGEKRLVLPESPPAPFQNLACQCLQKDSQLRWNTLRIRESLNERSSSPAGASREDSGVGAAPYSTSRPEGAAASGSGSRNEAIAIRT